MESFPEQFDPFGDFCPDFAGYQFDPDQGSILDNDGNPYDAPAATERCQTLAEGGVDPNPSLKQLLEAQFAASRPEPQDPVDTMPENVFYEHEGCYFFNDSAFLGVTMRGLQNCKNPDLTGWIILPAKYNSRIRSRYSNHGVPTKAVWVPQENFTGLAHFFE